jgi:large subunit ribosomal protein L22
MATARAKNVGISVHKLRLVMDQVRGMKVDDALAYLRYMTTPSAGIIYKVLNSAAANAENNDLQVREELVIKRIVADKSVTMRRFRPKARGRVGAFNRPTSHITIEVDEE